MKKTIILIAVILAAITSTFTSCTEDKLGDTIFDATDYPLDKSTYTFPLDTFVKKNFLEPYNLKFIYKMEDVGSDMQKNLVPATYEKSQQLAVLTKYLWLDVYKKLAGEEFLKVNCPRVIHVIGSPAYNSDGSRTLGEAEGGLKVTLMNTNALDINDIEGYNGLNKLFFHTMHHEFGHILDQTHVRPQAFNTMSTGLYDAVGWADKSDSIQAGLGFVTPYASSQVGEDWVEVLSCYVTYTDKDWNSLLETAHFDWEEVDMTQTRYDSLFYNYNEQGKKLGRKTVYDIDTIGYFRQTANGEEKCVRKVVARTPDDRVITDDNGHYTISTTADNIDGRDVILQKLDLVRTWLKEYWDIDVDELRHEVQTREYMFDENDKYLLDARGNYINKLTYPLSSGKTLMDQLMEEIENYKKLQQK